MMMVNTTTTVQMTEDDSSLCMTWYLFNVPDLVKVTGRVASLDVMFIPQTSKSSTTMAEASSTAISSSPCHLGGITRLAFAPDGQYVNLTSHLSFRYVRIVPALQESFRSRTNGRWSGVRAMD